MDWKKLGDKLLFPPAWLMIVLTAITLSLLLIVSATKKIRRNKNGK